MAADTYTFENGADLSAGFGLAVKVSSGKIIPVAGATDTPVGVLQENAPDSATSGHKLPVAVEGIAKVKAGAAFSAGVFLTMDANGRAVASTALTDVIIGVSLEAADAADDIVDAHITISPGRGT